MSCKWGVCVTERKWLCDHEKETKRGKHPHKHRCAQQLIGTLHWFTNKNLILTWTTINSCSVFIFTHTQTHTHRWTLTYIDFQETCSNPNHYYICRTPYLNLNLNLNPNVNFKTFLYGDSIFVPIWKTSPHNVKIDLGPPIPEPHKPHPLTHARAHTHTHTRTPETCTALNSGQLRA